MPIYVMICKKQVFADMPKNGVKSRKINVYKEFLRHDKNIIRLSRQDLPDMIKVFSDLESILVFSSRFRYESYSIRKASMERRGHMCKIAK